MTQTVTLPIPGLRGGVNFRVSVENETGRLDGLRKIAESGDFSGAMRLGPNVVRNGRGGYREQIRAKTWITPTGGRIFWTNPDYASGQSPFAARVREEVIWDAILGGTGGDETIGRDFFEVSVDDTRVKAESTALGNQLPVPAGVSYAGFVTGGIALTTQWTKRAAIPVKPSKARKPRNWKRKYAMYLFLGLTYRKWMTDDEMREGLYTPPKRIGYNPEMEQSLLRAFRRWWRDSAERAA